MVRLLLIAADLADRDIVFTMVGGPEDFIQVTLGDDGVLMQNCKPKVLIDCTSVDEAASSKVRAAAEREGVLMLAAPVSGNAKVVKAGKLTFAVSGRRNITRPSLISMRWDAALPMLGKELSRFIKICHNLMLGVVIQNVVEITVLAEKAECHVIHFLIFLIKAYWAPCLPSIRRHRSSILIIPSHSRQSYY